MTNKDNSYLKLIGSGFVFFISSAQADLPLTIENLITDKGRFKSELSISYANVDKQNVSIGDPIIVQTGETSFILVPGRVGEGNLNSDVLVGTLG